MFESELSTQKLSIIAMKGHHFTRKTEFANMIAAFLGCPILSSEHILSNLAPPLSPELEYKAVKIICGIALHHLYHGISENIVIDSSLTCKSHLIQLTSLAADLKPMQVRVIIIECKATNPYSWKLKLERSLAHRPPHKPKQWYKPKIWEDVEKAIRDNPGYDVDTSVKGYEFVSKLVVDPFLDIPVQRVHNSVNRFHVKPSTTPRLVEAVKYMMTRDQGAVPDVVVYRQWLQQFHLRSSSSSSSSSSSTTPAYDQNHCRRYGHNIVPNSKVVELGLQHEAADCRACKKQVRRNNEYCYCKNCSLALHMECAQAFGSHKASENSEKNHCFKKKLACDHCRESGEHFCDDCGTCLFESHLESHLVPTAIRHFDTEEHLLIIVLKPNQFLYGEVHHCAACGLIDRHYMYLCHDCGNAYHYECVTLPQRVKDVHGGYHHNLSLKFTSEEAEDYICQECLELRDPALWFYSCQDCPGYDLHPHCVKKLKRSGLAVQLRRTYK